MCVRPSLQMSRLERNFPAKVAWKSKDRKARLPLQAWQPGGQVLRQVEKPAGRNESLWQMRTQKEEVPGHLCR